MNIDKWNLFESLRLPLSQGDGGMVEHRAQSQVGQAQWVSQQPRTARGLQHIGQPGRSNTLKYKIQAQVKTVLPGNRLVEGLLEGRIWLSALCQPCHCRKESSHLSGLHQNIGKIFNFGKQSNCYFCAIIFHAFIFAKLFCSHLSLHLLTSWQLWRVGGVDALSYHRTLNEAKIKIYWGLRNN